MGKRIKHKLKNLFLILISIIICKPCFAKDTWTFKLTYESQQLADSPFFLNTAADLNKNGKKELIVADFGRFGDHVEEWKQWKQWKKDYYLYNLLVLGRKGDGSN